MGPGGGGGGALLWVQRDRLTSAATIDVNVDVCGCECGCARGLAWVPVVWDCLARHRGRVSRAVVLCSMWCSIRVRKQGIRLTPRVAAG